MACVSKTDYKRRLRESPPEIFRTQHLQKTLVDQFLAIPYFVNRFGARPISIEQSSYDDAASRFMKAPPKGFTQQQHKMARHFLIASNCAATFRFMLVNGDLKLVTKVGGPELRIVKPRGNTLPKNYKDWTESEK